MSCVAGGQCFPLLHNLYELLSLIMRYGSCRVPEALQPFMPGHMSFIPFRKRFDSKTKKYVRIADKAEQ